MGAITGLSCKIYLNTATYAMPTWAECKSVVDATLDLTWEEADASRRGSTFRQMVATLGSLEVNGKAIRDKDDTSFVALDSAARQKTIVDLLVLDGSNAVPGSEGYRFDGQIFVWTRNEGLADIVAHDFSIKPTLSANTPVYYTSV